MKPDFDDLVGAELEAAERARLERVHELLIAAGPPPDPPASPVALRPRRRRGALLALAAALAAAAFALGAVLVDGDGRRSLDYTETMTGTAASAEATASLAVYEVDEAGNWPMELTVSGLMPAASGRTYELWLTRGGELDQLCGSFRTGASGAASVPMNAPYPFDESIGWVVVETGSDTPLLTT
jgi:hypothetical protein